MSCYCVNIFVCKKTYVRCQHMATQRAETKFILCGRSKRFAVLRIVLFIVRSGVDLLVDLFQKPFLSEQCACLWFDLEVCWYLREVICVFRIRKWRLRSIWSCNWYCNFFFFFFYACTAPPRRGATQPAGTWEMQPVLEKWQPVLEKCNWYLRVVTGTWEL